jgi:hypothetical protein
MSVRLATLLPAHPHMRINHVVYRLALYSLPRSQLHCEAEDGSAGFFCVPLDMLEI